MSATARNMVIEGDYKGSYLKKSFSGKLIIKYSKNLIILSIPQDIELNKDTVQSHEILNESTSSTSTLTNKGFFGIGSHHSFHNQCYMVAVEFKNGKKSLLELNEEYYKALISKTF